ncbi:phycobiliprotein lyase [Oscillatoria sp. FACHB-1406]|uniref:phycobiliprotein lyase n=1 Tax=Oscillatoria sp. FACHB-1406 TaxID=2692846 RepID=UPI0016820F66|nr:phycobiliprotein lyase [Oscillatoria sp. FACHB-1406]MBD2576157.1 phycobiliprotein lyase [Oscillatoria sp. FACHB-1406]
MDIKEFFEQSSGKWFAQRTHYNLASQAAGSSKAEIEIEFLAVDAPEIVQLCEQQHVSSAQACGGLKISWDNSVDWGGTKEKGFAILVAVPDSENPQTGKFLRGSSNPKEQSLAGDYAIGEDEALTLTLENGSLHAEERLWFASPNLRLRSSFVKNNGRFSDSTFYSEIRRMVAPAT